MYIHIYIYIYIYYIYILIYIYVHIYIHIYTSNINPSLRAYTYPSHIKDNPHIWRKKKKHVFDGEIWWNLVKSPRPSPLLPALQYLGRRVNCQTFCGERKAECVTWIHGDRRGAKRWPLAEAMMRPGAGWWVFSVCLVNNNRFMSI